MEKVSTSSTAPLSSLAPDAIIVVEKVIEVEIVTEKTPVIVDINEVKHTQKQNNPCCLTPKKEECCPPKKEECCPPKKEECCPLPVDPCCPSATTNSWYGYGWNLLGALILWFIIFTVLFWLIYFSLKPSFVMDDDSNEVDTGKVLLASVISSIILVILVWIIKGLITYCYY